MGFAEWSKQGRIGSGRETVFYRFTGGNDGGVPYAPLVKDRLGRFVGTTWAGGVE